MLDKLLQSRDWLLADGATGTNLFAMGLSSGEAPELWNEQHPDRIRRLHQDFVDAGADIILTNSFGGTSRRLMLHNAHTRVGTLNRLAGEHARAVADAADRPIVVAGSVGPTGDLFAPLGALTEAEAVEVFVEQMEGLKAGGVDVFWIETMSAVEEMRAAALAAAKVGLPYTVTASFDTAGRTMMGITPETMASATTNFVPAPHGIGCNCGVGASDLLVSVLGITATKPDAVVIAKARLACDSGARIIGGCCGTSAAHLLAMRRSLEGYRRGARPDIAELVTRLGALAAPPAKEGAAPRRNRRREGA